MMLNYVILVVSLTSIETLTTVHQTLALPKYTLHIARDTKTAQEYLQQEEIDLILLEITDETNHGLELLRTIQTETMFPTILMTTNQGQTLTVEMLRLGVKNYILLPFETSKLQRMVEQILLDAGTVKFGIELKITKQALRQRHKELDTLFGVSKSIPSLTYQKLYQRVLEAAVYLIKAEEAVLLLYDPVLKRLNTATTWGTPTHLIAPVARDHFAECVVAEKQSLLLHNVKPSAKGYPQTMTALMYVPLLSHNQLIGILRVGNRRYDRPFTNHDLRLLSVLADYAAICIENGRLLNQTQQAHQHVSKLFQKFTDGIATVEGPEHRVTFANARFGALLGVPTPLEHPLSKLLPDPQLAIYLTQDEPTQFTQQFTLPNGQQIDCIIVSAEQTKTIILRETPTHRQITERLKKSFVQIQQKQRDLLRTDITPQQYPLVESLTNAVDSLASFVDALA